MWINKKYYNELLDTLELFSQGKFGFNENNFNGFNRKRYKRLTKTLINIRATSDKNVKNCVDMMNNIVAGNCDKMPEIEDDTSDFKRIYDQYIILLTSLNMIKNSVENLRILICNGHLNSKIELENLQGMWLENVSNVNEIILYLMEHKVDFINVLNKIAEGDLSEKITIDAKGEMLELKNTINQLVDQLSGYTTEIIKVTKEVGIERKFGVQADIIDATGVWLDLTKNVNLMSLSLADIAEKNKSHIWIQEGISLLSQELLHKEFVAEQFQIAINQLCRYVSAGMGAIYLYDSLEKVLNIEATYACLCDDILVKKVFLGEGIIGQVANDRQPIMMEFEGNRMIKSGLMEYPIVCTYTSPLIFKGELVGVIEIAHHRKFNHMELEYFERALPILAGSLYASIMQLKNQKELEVLSNTDALTGLYNRGYFDKVTPEMLAMAKRTDSFICFAMLDIDYFKEFNDQYGHSIGDVVLKRVANVMQSNLMRKEDYCFRIGGEEFAIMFSAINREKAFDFMDSIRNKIEELVIPDSNLQKINKVTVSMGLTCKRASEIPSIEVLFEETDKLLYKAKSAGRNKIVQND